MSFKFLTSKLLADVSSIKHAFLPIGAPLPEGFVHCHQVHSSKIIMVDQPIAFEKEKADGLMTKKFQPIGIITADCLPVVLTDASGSCVAAVHAGWRGLKNGILFEVIKMFEIEGFNAKHLRVAIGPSIHSCCYEVGDEVIDELQSSFNYLWKNSLPPWFRNQPKNQASLRSMATERKNGIWLDLVWLARLQLQYCGIESNYIELVGDCTYCGPDSFDSFRRNTHEKKINQFQYSWIGKVSQ